MRSDRALALSPETVENPALQPTLSFAPRSVEPSLEIPALEVSLEAVADLVDLVSAGRPDLLPTFLHVLATSAPAREHATELTDLVTACGTSTATAPCRSALAIAADLDVLSKADQRWSHPAQILQRPAIQALRDLCSARLENGTDAQRQGLEEILPRLVRAAELERKAATRRSRKGSTARTDWIQSWL